MKRAVLIAVFLLSVFSCRKQEKTVPVPERELSVPEKVEKELMDVLSKDWKSLADTLAYFDSTMLSKGQFKGTAPDGVYYELSVDKGDDSGVEAVFKIQDSIWVAVRGQLKPTEVTVTACDTEISIKKEDNDSTGLYVSNVGFIVPGKFLFEQGHESSLLYEGRRAGYLTLERFEDTDYSGIICLVVHYYNDPRTFALIDDGFFKLLMSSLGYAPK